MGCKVSEVQILSPRSCIVGSCSITSLLTWLLFPMLLLSILAHFHSNTVRSLERRPSTMGARPITQGRAKEAKNYKVGKRKLGVASSAILLDNTPCLF